MNRNINSNINMPVAEPIEIPTAEVIAPIVAIPVDDDVPMAAVAPDAVPVAIPVAGVDLDAQALERDRQQRIELERAQQARMHLEQETIRQQKQQQEKQQKELQKAQQELKKAQQDLAVDSVFIAKQASLIEEYNRHMLFATEYRNLGNLEKAIREYNLAIDAIESLKSAYTSKEHSKGTFFINVPDVYDNNYILKARLDIVDCFISGHDLERAYYSLKELKKELKKDRVGAYIVEKRLVECCKLIQNRADKLVLEVSNMSMRGDAQRIALAQDKLREAEKLLRVISKTPGHDFVSQQTRIEWEMQRDDTNKACHALLHSQLALSSYGGAAQRARAIIELYATYSTFLDAEERAYQAKIIGFLPILEQVTVQIRINELMFVVEKSLAIGDIMNAHLAMSTMYNLALEIKNPHYVEAVGLVYNHPATYLVELKNIESQMLQFKERSKQQHGLIVDLIIKRVLEKIGENTTNPSLFEKDLAVLRSTLALTIQDEWYKFDRRPEPFDFIDNLATQIAADCSGIGIVKSWWYWSYATTCFKDTTKTLANIKHQICSYVPVVLPDVAININGSLKFKP